VHTEAGSEVAREKSADPTVAAATASTDDASPGAREEVRSGPGPIHGNPAATTQTPGSGWVGRKLGLPPHGVSLGGLWFVDLNGGVVGGLAPGSWRGQNLLILYSNFDLEKLVGWKGGSFGTSFLNHGGSSGSAITGDVQGFEGLDGGPPLTRTEFYQLWFLQTFLDERVSVRIGKVVPTYDFAVLADATVLLFTPIFTYPTMLGRVPGYPDSATGVTAFVSPVDPFYVGYGFYDGRLGSDGTPTGNRAPAFDGRYFTIGEAGGRWRLAGGRPGGVGIGGWGQIGPVDTFDGGTQRGTSGFYAFAKQNLWRHPSSNPNGISAYLAVGTADPSVELAETYVGGGLSWTGAISARESDSFAFGFSWSDLTRNADAAAASAPTGLPEKLPPNELLLQGTYQIVLLPEVFLQPALTWIPHPGRSTGIQNALALTLRFGVLF
jgi:porin